MRKVAIQGDVLLTQGALTIHDTDQSLTLAGKPIEGWIMLGSPAVQQAFRHKLVRYQPCPQCPWRAPLDGRVLRRIADYEIEESTWDVLIILADKIYHLQRRSYRPAKLIELDRPYAGTYLVQDTYHRPDRTHRLTA